MIDFIFLFLLFVPEERLCVNGLQCLQPSQHSCWDVAHDPHASEPNNAHSHSPWSLLC